MTQPAGIRSLAVSVPTGTREITLPNGQKAWRHFLAPDQSGLDLDKDAAQQALDAAGLEPADVDLIIGASFPALPQPCIGNATAIAFETGMERAAAYNLESACAGGLLALRTACQEVRLGEHENVLVVVGCPYSETLEPGHPAADVIGDAAFAFVVGPTRKGQDFLAGVARNSGPTCPLVSWGISDKTRSGIRLNVGAHTAGQLEAWAHEQLPELSQQLFERSGLAAGDVKHWVINAPTLSFADKAMQVMGTSPANGVNINRLFGNIGPALPGVGLYYNALIREFEPGDLVLCCSVGSESSLALAVFEWPEDVAFGKVPAHASLETMKEIERERLEKIAAVAVA